MTAVDTDAIRSLLEERREETRARIAELSAPTERGTAQGFGKRIGDGTIEAVSRLTDIGVGSTLETTLARTERALEKLEAGTYGVCDSCDRPIPPRRLEAMPDTVLCLECAAAQRRTPPRRR